MDDINIGYEIKYIYLDGKMIMYRLHFWHNHYIEVKINRQAEVNVYARKKDNIQDIENCIKDKKLSIFWWQMHQDKLMMNLPKNLIVILDKKYTLKPINKKLKSKFEILGNVIYINAKNDNEKMQLVPLIFDVTACEYIRKSTKHWAIKMGYQVKKIIFRWSKTYWGMCCPTKKLLHTLTIYVILIKRQLIL